MAQPLKLAAMLAPVAVCLFEFTLQYYSKSFFNYKQAFLSLPCLSSISLLIWCGVFTVLTHEKKDVFVIVFLAIAAFLFFLNVNHPSTEAFILFLSLVVGKWMRFFSRQNFATKSGKVRLVEANIILHDNLVNFLIGLVFVLTLSSWWHLDFTKLFYHGPRWMGLWDNPNTYGMLMGAGLALAIGLLAGSQKSGVRSQKLMKAFLFIAAGMLGMGLVMSYSRGASLATAVGLLYLAWNYGKLKLWFVVLGMVIVVAGVFYFWGSTPDSAPWYIKRADLGRPSAQHRVAAWRAGLEIMRNHPLGVGWNNAVSTYAKNYLPPKDGVGAITTNDYLMLGTELGIPALLCFVSYVALCLRGKLMLENEEGRIQAACRAGAIVFLVAFWFDDGLFKLATATTFWVLLELGSRSVFTNITCAPRMCIPCNSTLC